ncbi:CBS domain-containing protein [Kitasatospora arboriphila]
MRAAHHPGRRHRTGRAPPRRHRCHLPAGVHGRRPLPGRGHPSSLTPFLACAWYSDHSQVQDAMRRCDPFAWPTLALPRAAVTMRVRGLDPWPVVDEDGHLLGILTRTSVTALLAAPDAPDA